ncbi:MAG: type II secretion system protein [Patescibacteria group bacterium]
MSSIKFYPNTGFTLVELIVVIAIIGLLSSLSIVGLNSAREKAKITRRLADMKQIQTALEVYYDIYGYYPPPNNNDDNCSGWDTGNKDHELLAGYLPGIMNIVPGDQDTTGCNGYNYYRYGTGNYGCNSARGAYYVLGIRGTGKTYPTSPGWTCPNRSWNGEFEWVAGAFER